MADAVVVTCGSARWPGAGVAASVVAPVVPEVVTVLPARPGRAELGPLLAGLDGRRLVVCGTDADLAAVLLRLLRTDLLAAPVGYVPSSPSSAVARLWGLPVEPSAAALLALQGEPGRVPLVRDDAGGVLVGFGVVRPLDGVAYCDDEVVLRGQASRLEVTPDPALGLAVRVVRGGLLRRRTRCAAGRAVQLGCASTEVWRDGVPARITDRWTWYRHTDDWRLIRPRPQPRRVAP